MKPFIRFFVLVLVLAACNQPLPDLPPVSVTVDPALKPPVETLPGFEDGEPRPIASVTGEDGVQAEFVSNEVWLSSDNESEVQAFVGRWQGKILQTLDPAKAGVTELPKQYLIRVNAAAADASKLSEDLRTLDKNSTGAHRVSSQDGLNLITVSSREAASGLNIGMNWVGSGAQQFSDRTSMEAPSGEPLEGIAYVKDAFTWPSHDRFSEQDIGVAEAWRALDLARKLSNKVKLAVLDMGFQPDTDWPSGYEAISNVPAVVPIGTENFLSCGNSDCPWHGTSVLSAAMAVPDNNYGIAGPAGPIADAVVVFTSYDFFTSIAALLEARILGAKIANMSYGAPVPWYLGWSVLPFEGTTFALRGTGLLMFAAAGNAGQDVDSESCDFGQCWERTWYTPCENAGVICVGGLAVNSKNKAGSSNYGGEQVDMFAPFTLWVGSDPSAPDNHARVSQGTSLSSPFTAGVAALIWAADPDLSANRVEEILLDTAHPSPDGKVKQYVNALGAVLEALGNIPPSITIAGSGDVPQNVQLEFSADVFDFEDPFPCCTITWSSDVDGPFGTGRVVKRTLSTLGPRTLTVTATDSAGATSTATKAFNVVNPEPDVTLSRPQAGETALRTVPFFLRGRAADANEPNFQLACSRVTWTSSVASDPLPVTGCDVAVTFTTNGSRTITLTATDPQGATDSASVSLNVVEPPPNLAPSVRVTSPADRADLPRDQPITLSGTAADPEGGTPLTYQWTVKLNNGSPIVVGTSSSVQWTPSDTYNLNGAGTYIIQIRLNVTDPQGNTGTDFVTLEYIIIG
jgi:serine protease